MDIERRTPPSSPALEQAVLGAMILDPVALETGLETCRVDFFYLQKHRLVFQTLTDLAGAGEAVNLVTVVERLKDQGKLDYIGGESVLADYLDKTPSPAGVKSYIAQVREYYLRRAIIRLGAEACEQGFQSGNTGEVLAGLERQVFELLTNRQVEAETTQHLAHRVWEEVSAAAKRGENLTGLPTGLADLDKITHGLQPADMIVVAARPSIGKSTLVGEITRHLVLRKNIPVAFFSVESDRALLYKRLLSAESGVPFWSLVTGRKMDTGVWEQLTAAQNKLYSSPLFIDDDSGLTPTTLRTRARRLVSNHGIKLIIVDYIGLMRPDEKQEKREQVVAEISSRLKALAKETGIPVIVVSQLNRNLEARTDKRPQLADLRESGALEQDADLVLLLFRKEMYDDKCPESEKNMMEILVSKHRNGGLGVVKANFHGEKYQITNREGRHSGQ